jgi:hypothetical protein
VYLPCTNPEKFMAKRLNIDHTRNVELIKMLCERRTSAEEGTTLEPAHLTYDRALNDDMIRLGLLGAALARLPSLHSLEGLDIEPLEQSLVHEMASLRHRVASRFPRPDRPRLS